MAFKVPEQFRSSVGIGVFGRPGEPHGAFVCESPDKGRVTKTMLTIIASAGDPSIGVEWEHVSAKASKNIGGKVKYMIPTWDEMCYVKSLFWDPEDCVMQLHPPESEYVNYNEAVLHLWRPIGVEIPQPPKICV